MEPTPSSIVALIREAVLRDTGSAGSLLFLNDSKKLDQDNSNLFYDSTNARLGVGTTAPQSKVDAALSSASVAAVGARQSTAAGPVLHLAGLATADVLTQSLVAGASVTTATKALFARVHVTDSNEVITAGDYYLQLFTIA